MNKTDIINSIVKNAEYKQYCKKLCYNNKSSIHEDLYQEFLLVLCETDEDYLIKLNDINQLNLYCFGIIFRINGMRIRPAVFNPCKNPLYEIVVNNSVLIENNRHLDNYAYNINIDYNANKVLDYVSKDKTIKVEDWLLFTEALDRKLIDISKESGIPYITLKVKHKKLKDKIRRNVNI